MSDLTDILLRLVEGGVQFVLVGGLAAVTHGAPVTTFDVDIVHERTETNVRRLLAVLTAIDARYRGDPRALAPTPGALMGPRHHTLSTALGPLDVTGAVEQGQDYAQLWPQCVALAIHGRTIHVLRLETLVELKQQWSDPESQLRAEILRRTLAASKGEPPSEASRSSFNR